MGKGLKSKTDDVENQICQLILKRSLPEGAQIPSESMICENYHVSRITARRAVANLVSKGVLYTEHGRGSFVKSFAQTQKIYGADVLSHTIGLFMPRDGYFMSAVYGVEDVVKNAGFRIFVSSFSSESFRDHAKEILDYAAGGMDGAIINTPESSPYPSEYLELFQKLKNVVVFNSPSPSPEIASVSSDDVEGMTQVMRYLFSLGHRRIAFLGGETCVATTRDRLSGYRQALMECPGAEKEIVLFCKEYVADDACRVLGRCLESDAPLPTALVCATDELASYAYRSLLSHGIRIPEEISVIGYGNLDLAYKLTPPLTSVDHHPQEQGRLAGELLLRQIFRQEIPVRQMRVQPSLHIKQSCAVPKQQERKG